MRDADIKLGLEVHKRVEALLGDLRGSLIYLRGLLAEYDYRLEHTKVKDGLPLDKRVNKLVSLIIKEREYLCNRADPEVLYLINKCDEAEYEDLDNTIYRLKCDIYGIRVDLTRIQPYDYMDMIAHHALLDTLDAWIPCIDEAFHNLELNVWCLGDILQINYDVNLV